MKLLKFRSLTTCSVAAAAFIGSAASAQVTATGQSPETANTAATAEDTGGLDDIIVTARRTAEVAQSVPVTVSAFSGEKLRESSITTATDIMLLTPGISTQGTGSPINTYYSIRGISRQITGNGQPGVISYFAEVPLPYSASNLPFFDMANVQVLKGPQGTLFGRNTVGGALLLYPETPKDDLGGYLMGRIQNFNGQAVEGAVNAPIIPDKLSLRVAGLYDKQDGYTRNLSPVGPSILGGHKERAVRASLLVTPFDGLRNTTILDYDRLNSTTPAIILSGPTPAAAFVLPQFLIDALTAEVAAQKASGPRVTNTGPFHTFEKVRRKGIVNRTEVDLSDEWSLVNIFGYRAVDYTSSPNLDGSQLQILDSFRRFQRSQISDELQVRGSFFDSNVNVIAGAFYLKDRPSGSNANTTTVFFNTQAAYSWESNSSKALFGNISVKFDKIVDGLKFNAGFRYTWDKVSNCAGAALPPGTPGSVPGVATLPFDVLGKNDCKASTPGLTNVSTIGARFRAPGWTIGLDWQANRSLFLYAVSRRGYRAGGVNNPKLVGVLTPFQTFRPETNTDLEIGLKSDWRVGGVAGRFNISAFYSWQKNVQIAYTGISNNSGACPWIDGDCNLANDPASGSLTINSGKTRVRGIEAELVLKPTPALTLNLAGSLIDPAIIRAALPGGPLAPYVASAGRPDQFLNQNIAKRTLSAAVSYDLPLPEGVGKVTFGANYYYSSRVPVNALIIPAYDETNVRLDWKEIAGGPVDVSLFAKNVFDQTNLVAASISPVAFAPFLVAGFYNTPRTYGIEARIHW